MRFLVSPTEFFIEGTNPLTFRSPFGCRCAPCWKNSELLPIVGWEADRFSDRHSPTLCNVENSARVRQTIDEDVY